MWQEDDFLQLSGLQHFAFCRRQWALIHIENQWQENLRTVEGALLHTRAHDEQQREKRGDTLILRGLPIFSASLGLSGKCDITEFHRDTQGVSLTGEEGLWLPYPVEYKRGSPKNGNEDKLQLCAQAMCLEEMLCFAVLSRKDPFFTGRPAGGFLSYLPRSCAKLCKSLRKKCTAIFSVGIRQR